MSIRDFCSERSGLGTWWAGFVSTTSNAAGSLATFTSRTIFPVSHNAVAGLLDRNVQSSKIAHAALLLLVLEAVTTDLVSPSA